MLDTLNRETKGPFVISDASRILKIEISSARRLISYWVSRGWLTRIRRGLYATVPLGAINPAERKEDPWVVAANIFEPCYIGGWSACEHWGLTDQIFKDIVVFTSRKVRHKRNEIQDTVYIVRSVKEEKLFGTKPVWGGQTKILVSDPSRTIVDILSEPNLGGGIRNVATILEEYYSGELKDEAKLTDYLLKLKNGAIFKRLGYLIETLNIDSSKIIELCKENITSGYSILDPSLPRKGKILRRWNLRINALIEKI
jgi:predicted transcriptional regulator of viral defense system